MLKWNESRKQEVGEVKREHGEGKRRKGYDLRVNYQKGMGGGRTVLPLSPTTFIDNNIFLWCCLEYDCRWKIQWFLLNLPKERELVPLH